MSTIQDLVVRMQRSTDVQEVVRLSHELRRAAVIRGSEIGAERTEALWRIRELTEQRDHARAWAAHFRTVLMYGGGPTPTNVEFTASDGWDGGWASFPESQKT